MAPESAGTGGPCESYHRCPGCGRCCCRCRRRPLEDPGPAGVIVTATAGGARIPAAGPARFRPASSGRSGRGSMEWGRRARRGGRENRSCPAPGDIPTNP